MRMWLADRTNRWIGWLAILSLNPLAAFPGASAAEAAGSGCSGGVSIEVAEGPERGAVDCYRIAAPQQAIVATRLLPSRGDRRKLQVITALTSIPSGLGGAVTEHTKVSAIAGAQQIVAASDQRTFYVTGSQPRSTAVFWRDVKTGQLHFSANKRFPTPAARDAFLARILAAGQGTTKAQ